MWIFFIYLTISSSDLNEPIAIISMECTVTLNGIGIWLVKLLIKVSTNKIR